MKGAAASEFLIWYLIFILALTIHEAAHALAALLGGDKTAYHGGQVTLNPLPHMQREPFGTILIPILTYIYSGWMMGWASAPYDPVWGKRHPRRQAAMSAAGPAANLLLVILTFLAIKGLLAGGVVSAPWGAQDFSHLVEPSEAFAESSWARSLAFGLSIALNLNFLLFLFNLIPLPPLDGSGLLAGLFPRSVGRILDPLERTPMFSILGLVIAWKLFEAIAPPMFSWLWGLV